MSPADNTEAAVIRTSMAKKKRPKMATMMSADDSHRTPTPTSLFVGVAPLDNVSFYFELFSEKLFIVFTSSGSACYFLKLIFNI